jgi:predicted methyltransferase
MRFWSLTVLFVFGCSPAAEQPPVTAPQPEPVPLAPAPVIAEPAPPAPAPLTPEEQKAADERKKLEADFATLEQSHAAELARLTPEVRTAARAVADTAYPNTRAALNAALSASYRRPGHAARDAQRHPRETLEFFGLKPNQTVLEIGPGEGWYTELLAPVVAKNGKLFVTQTDPTGPKDQRSSYYGYRTKLFLEALPEVYSKVEPITIDPKAPKLPLEASVDLVLLSRGAHGMHNNKTLGLWLAELHRVLKPKGVLAIEQHRAAPGKNPDETSKQGYLPEAFLIEEVEKAGFKLAAKSEINANKKDTKDHPDGVWSLPPTFRGGDKDRDKYAAIGESDRMTLKFVKRDPPKAAAAPAVKPAAAPAKQVVPGAAPSPVKPPPGSPTTGAVKPPASSLTSAAAPASPPAPPAGVPAKPKAAPAAPPAGGGPKPSIE